MQHVKRWIVVVAIAGCTSSKPSSPSEAAKPVDGAGKPLSSAAAAPPSTPAVEIVQAQGAKLKFLSIDSGKVVERRTIEAPNEIVDLRWSSRELVVAFGTANLFQEGLPDDVQVGIVTEKGIDVIPLPAKKTWTIRRPKGTKKVGLSTKLVTTTSEIWLARCEWGDFGIHGDSVCTEWVYARLRPGPVVTSRKAPVEPAGYPEPALTAPKGYQIEIVAPPGADEYANNSVRCTHNGKATVVADGVTKRHTYHSVRWISVEPPLFQIGYLIDSGDMEQEEVWDTYEGCATSRSSALPTEFEPQTLQAGPNGAFAMRDENKSIAMIVSQGRQVAILQDVNHLEFVPQR